MITKEQLKGFYNLRKAIRETQDELVPNKYLEGWFLWFEDIWSASSDLYKQFDPDEYSIIEWLDHIVEDWLEEYDMSLLKEKDKKKFMKSYKSGTMSMWDDLFETDNLQEDQWIFLTKEFKNQCKYCLVKFENIDEVIDYMYEKMWI